MDTFTAKRDTFTTCPVCGETFRQDGIGRMRKFCSDACKMKAHRRAASGKPARREYNTLRTDYLESHIAFYRAKRDYGAEDALRTLARDVSAPIDETEIEKWRKIYATELTRSLPTF